MVLVGILGTGYASYAQLEKEEVNLFTCTIADNPVYQQLVFKYITVSDGGENFQYFVMDAEVGNEYSDRDGEGHHLKYIRTLVTTQNADSDSFVRTSSRNYAMDMEFSGSQTFSDITINFDLLSNGDFVLDLRGQGPLYDFLLQEFNEVMDDSNFYGRYDMPECSSHPNLRNYLD